MTKSSHPNAYDAIRKDEWIEALSGAISDLELEISVLNRITESHWSVLERMKRKLAQYRHDGDDDAGHDQQHDKEV